ncbi:hypothetical protein B0H19DRAFT_1256911 [Mycena capillaripes]|nr:hypothetical protein B0H19DRAFT_1256911 [Mycena capillaripes]
MKCLAISLSALGFFGTAAALPLDRKSTSSPGTMKGYLQLRGEVGAAMRPYLQALAGNGIQNAGFA